MTCKDCIYDKMCYFIQTEKHGVCKYEPYWHTEEPTEEGYYVAIDKGWESQPFILEYNSEIATDEWDCVIAWHKIPDYEECAKNAQCDYGQDYCSEDCKICEEQK